MNDYFKPRRRKIGVAMLCLATASLVAWGRSLMVEDFLGNSWFSRNGAIEQVVDIFRVPAVRINLEEDDQGNLIEIPLKTEPSSVKPPNPAIGFQPANTGIRTVTEVTVWWIPYWAITLTLTLISAWLLFSNARKVKTSRPAQCEDLAAV